MRRVLHCFEGKREYMEKKYGWFSTQHAATFEDGGDGTCMRKRGHKGPHRWTPDDQIVVSFRAERASGKRARA